MSKVQRLLILVGGAVSNADIELWTLDIGLLMVESND